MQEDFETLSKEELIKRLQAQSVEMDDLRKQNQQLKSGLSAESLKKLNDLDSFVEKMHKHYVKEFREHLKFLDKTDNIDPVKEADWLIITALNMAFAAADYVDCIKNNASQIYYYNYDALAKDYPGNYGKEYHYNHADKATLLTDNIADMLSSVGMENESLKKLKILVDKFRMSLETVPEGKRTELFNRRFVQSKAQEYIDNLRRNSQGKQGLETVARALKFYKGIINVRHDGPDDDLTPLTDLLKRAREEQNN
ncbi:MAG: hypothetical protein LBJ73_04720 [Rickettsiales bacterium]|jgi:hypothetical protein|nr:hypothetical protein [Rickettsiales bacterium]